MPRHVVGSHDRSVGSSNEVEANVAWEVLSILESNAFLGSGRILELDQDVVRVDLSAVPDRQCVSLPVAFGAQHIINPHRFERVNRSWTRGLTSTE